MKRIEFTIKEKNPKKVTAIVRIFSGQTIGDMKEQKTFMATNEQGTFALTPVNTSSHLPKLTQYEKFLTQELLQAYHKGLRGNNHMFVWAEV